MNLLIVSRLKSFLCSGRVFFPIALVLVLFLLFSAADVFLFALSYTIGFALFYFILKFKDVFFSAITKFTLKGIKEYEAPNGYREDVSINCNICGGQKCVRYSNKGCQEPWTNIHIHKQLDEAIENFYNAIIQTFVIPWYAKLTREDTLIVEIRYLLRYASSSLMFRATKINVGELILKKFIPSVLRHYALCDESKKLMSESRYNNLEEAALNGLLKDSMHCALHSREHELEYLRCITEEIMPLLLPQRECESKLFSTLIREIFAGWVLLSLTDILADPHIINTLIVLATSDEKLSKLPDTPNYQVEFLKNFVRRDSYKRMRLLNLEVIEILKSSEYLYSFMQFMKANGRINLLQFSLDLDDFNKKMLQPDISNNEKLMLFKRANELYNMYYSHDSSSFIPFNTELVEMFKSILDEGMDNIIQLQTSKVLFESYDYVFSLLDQEWAPKFFDSYEFYKLIVPNIMTEPKKSLSNSKMDKNNPMVIGKPLSKLKDAFKAQAIEGQFDIDINDIPSKSNEVDYDTDLESQYSDILAKYTRLKNKDMASWRISIEKVTEQKANNKSGFVHWFCINVKKIDPHGIGSDTQWAIERTDDDFHILKEKLIEFHGENILSQIKNPPKRARAATEIRKKKYEVFLQSLLGLPVLKCSDLLHMFLTADADFVTLAREASSDSSAFPDFGNLYQTVTHKLRKEKGQNLDTFLQTFLISADLEYYQSLNDDKKKSIDDEDEAKDVMDDVTLIRSEKKITRILTDSIFGNNFNTKNPEESVSTSNNLGGFPWDVSDCVLFILSDVFKVRSIIIHICSFLRQIGNFDKVLISLVNHSLFKIFTQPRIGHLIKLGQDLLFTNPVPDSSETDRKLKSQLAKNQLQRAFPVLFCKAMGPNYLTNVDALFEYLQNPRLNKQLVYNLLDVLLLELFPELESKP